MEIFCVPRPGNSPLWSIRARCGGSVPSIIAQTARSAEIVASTVRSCSVSTALSQSMPAFSSARIASPRKMQFRAEA